MKVAGAAERLTGPHPCTTLARVMDEDDGEVVPPLELTQVREQRCDFTGLVFVDAVQPHERIQDEELGPERSDRRGERVAVALHVEPHQRRSDHVDVEVGEVESSDGGDAGEPLPNHVQRVLGGEEQYAAGLRRRKPPQAGHAAGDRHGHVEPEERLAADLTHEPKGTLVVDEKMASVDGPPAKATRTPPKTGEARRIVKPPRRPRAARPR